MRQHEQLDSEAHPDLRLQLRGMAGCQYIIERFPDLVEWSPVSTNLSMDGLIEFTERSPGRSNYFYRSVIVPGH